MNDNEINIAIAEACGWKLKRQFTGQVKGAGVWFDSNGDLRSWTCIPNYTTDLNAMHEAEKAFVDGRWFGYVDELDTIVNPHIRLSREYEGWCLIRATARQRAEAFLRTIGKWKD